MFGDRIKPMGSHVSRYFKINQPEDVEMSFESIIQKTNLSFLLQFTTAESDQTVFQVIKLNYHHHF